MSANETCPICREPLVGQAAPAAAPRWSQGAYEQELVFRLMRLHTCVLPHPAPTLRARAPALRSGGAS